MADPDRNRTAEAEAGLAPAATAELPVLSIDRASPVPFYFQLAEALEQEIVASRWVPGTRVPSENELCSYYELSRTTIRQALARLEQEGLVTRQKGRGTFVSGSQPRSWMIQSTEGFFHDEFLRAGREVTSRVLRLERGVLPRWATNALALPHDANGLVLERLRSVDGSVALYVVNCLPDFASDAAVGLDASESLYQRLAESGIAVIGGRRSLESVPAGAKLAQLLELDAGAAVAYIESVSWDETERPVDCYRAWVRTDRMRLEIKVAAPYGGTTRQADLPQPMRLRAGPG